ncbi:nicotinamide riboside transporter PnuC [Alkalitalea saponilacus]|uniref:Nicotinamide riboside transporter PnuC n=1 Tax=Alkalitalea saponilacus TaxID=889453 RepID=A0A1T5HAE1_9BACT|nr:nicotinamide riboside transporter PnuC [Alkalitalea saponilacus]ASB50809.1 nicotinamide mononucleotide transporter [Alkalitalea saponilacus]SKC17511.1 nicotinamide mononucleotide transporter [Alkalitalea saponilacus]
MVNWIVTHWMELAGTLFALIYLYLSIRENIWLWLFGFLTSFLYLIIFFQSRLYADMGLQFYYLIISIYGWFHWMGRRNGIKRIETNLATTSVGGKQAVLLFMATAVIMLIIYVALKTLPQLLAIPESELPVADAFTTAAGIVATWMLARKILENWLIWIVANTVSFGMYIYKDLYVTSFLFLVYTIMAVVGYYQWKRNM